MAALGDLGSPLWPALEAAGVEVLARSEDPATLYAAALARLDLGVPERVVVLDADQPAIRRALGAFHVGDQLVLPNVPGPEGLGDPPAEQPVGAVVAGVSAWPECQARGAVAP